MINLFSSDLFLKYSFLFSFIVYRILMVIVQYYFLISFTNVNSKFWCFILYSIISIFLIIINTYFNLYNLFSSQILFFLMTFLFVKYIIK
ncbi:ATP-binding protein, partial [Clostridioides difficile]|nr:ATP-binding protein [Clostridioides difficile]